MSTGDDVLENWEEIDEVELESRLNQINRHREEPSNNQLNHQGQNSLAMSFHKSIPMMMVMQQTENEYNSSSYTTQAMPTVKILRRPVQHSTVLNRNNCELPKQPPKTLQQREQEYAQARLRILGSAKNPEDDVEALSQRSPVEQSSSNINNTIMHTEIVIGGGVKVDSNMFSPTSKVVGGKNMQYNENVLRMPRGPDGTNGFQLRR